MNKYYNEFNNKNFDVIDDDLDDFNNERQTKISLISPSVTTLLSQNNINNETANIHDVIKKVQDSMDHLRHDLLQKDMPSYANDIGKLNQNLEVTRKKQEGIEKVKREQEVLKLERVRLVIIIIIIFEEGLILILHFFLQGTN